MCGGVVEDIEKAVVQPIGRGLAEVDKTVNREIPGGWTLPAAIAVAYATGYLDPSLFAAEGATVVGSEAAATAAGEAAYSSAIASGATAAEATAAANSAAASYATGASGAGLLDAAALAEGGTTAGMGAAANTGLPFGTETLGGTATGGSYAYDVEAQPGGFYGGGEAPQATIIPGELGDIILDASGNVVTSSGSDILAAPSSFSLSPGQALQGLRAASGLLGGRQQPQQPIPQMQMGGRTQMPQGAVDYSGIYNLLALQRARNPNSLLG